MTSLRILVVDDHAVVRRGVRSLLESHEGWEVCGEATTGRDAVEQTRRLRPDVVVMDLSLPELNGLDATRQILKDAPETEVLVLTMHHSEELARDVLQAGARGFVLKEAPLPDLVRAVETVAAGKTYVDPVLAGVIASAEVATQIPSLSQRQREVLRLLADGHKNEEIGKRLFISPETVRTHVRKAMAKLEADTRTEAVATALRQSLIT